MNIIIDTKALGDAYVCSHPLNGTSPNGEALLTYVHRVKMFFPFFTFLWQTRKPACIENSEEKNPLNHAYPPPSHSRSHNVRNALNGKLAKVT